MSTGSKGYRVPYHNKGRRKKICAAASNVTPFRRSASLRRTPRQPNQQNRGCALQTKVTPEVKAMVMRICRMQQRGSVSDFLNEMLCALFVAESRDRSSEHRAESPILMLQVQFRYGMSSSTLSLLNAHEHIMRGPIDVRIEGFLTRLRKFRNPAEAEDFIYRAHPDIGGLSPAEAVRQGQHRMVDRLIKRYEHDVRATKR